MKNEMISRLLGLSGTLQMEIGGTIPLPIHKLLRRNIFIRAELLKFVNEIFARKESCAKLQMMEEIHRSSILEHKKGERKSLITVKIQTCLLKALKKLHSSMKERVACLDESQKFIQEIYDNLADSANKEYLKCEMRTSKLEVLLHQERIKLGRVQYLKSNTELREKIYNQILYDVKYAVACLLRVCSSYFQLAMRNNIF
ncbi:uncharacterized protein [Venturia canescens]|uniref:uncharacterized protein isoform X1 n=1 Tax=Venturia canescens TaxID=32260 RepID=UPI001C9BCA1A|nr:uncharacterized protein LOC122408763 isoform X1 [Venturia canescens]XP_043271714.1 uncharacterized protein LOC122408763 isoform X1 [Venturia canescens]